MEKISKNELDKAPPIKEVEVKPEFKELSPEEFEANLKKLDNPVDLQKEIAVKLKHFLDCQIAKETRENGVLSDYIRRWVKDYNDVLDKIQKSLHGDTKINLHFGKVTHAHIAAKIRKYKNVTPVEVDDEKTTSSN